AVDVVALYVALVVSPASPADDLGRVPARAAAWAAARAAGDARRRLRRSRLAPRQAGRARAPDRPRPRGHGGVALRGWPVPTGRRPGLAGRAHVLPLLQRRAEPAAALLSLRGNRRPRPRRPHAGRA